MSKDIVMVKHSDGTLAATDAIGIEYLQGLPIGRNLGVTVTQARNYKFHKKVFALLGYLFDALPKAKAEYNGQVIEQSFDTFRREMVALSGHYRADVTRRGTLRIEPQSLSYSQCSEELAQTIYSDLIDKALELLGGDQTRDGLDEIVNDILRFA